MCITAKLIFLLPKVMFTIEILVCLQIFVFCSKHLDKIKIPKQVLCVFPTTSSVRLNYYH